MSLGMRYALAGFGVLTAIGIVGMAGARQTLGPNEASCMSNVRQVGTGFVMYIQDYDEMLPPMKSMAGVQNRLTPYTKSNALFTCPATKKPYKQNPAVGSRLLADFVEPAKAVTFYDALPHSDTQSTIGYLDGHVTREPKVPTLTVKLTPRKIYPATKRRRSRR